MAQKFRSLLGTNTENHFKTVVKLSYIRSCALNFSICSQVDSLWAATTSMRLLAVKMVQLQYCLLPAGGNLSQPVFLSPLQRALEPPDVHHERLLPVSVAGLLVNLVGVFVFQHGGHGHSHGGDGGAAVGWQAKEEEEE